MQALSLELSWSLAFALTLAPDITTPRPAAFASSSTACDTTSQACAATSDIWGMFIVMVGSTDLYHPQLLRMPLRLLASFSFCTLWRAQSTSAMLCRSLDHISPCHGRVCYGICGRVPCHLRFRQQTCDPVHLGTISCRYHASTFALMPPGQILILMSRSLQRSRRSHDAGMCSCNRKSGIRDGQTSLFLCPACAAQVHCDVVPDASTRTISHPSLHLIAFLRL